MRKDIEFTSKGLKCRGWLYIPDNLAEGDKAPAVVMAHGLSAVKEMFLPNYAERFCNAGLVTLVFDFRFLGESEGEPAGQIFPVEQLEDYRNAISCVAHQPEVNPDRIGAWGSSFSGGHVLHLAAFDRRIKAVVAQVPNINTWKSFIKLQGRDGWDMTLGMINTDRASRYQSDEINYVPVVAPEGEVALLSTSDSYEWFTKTAESIAPNWINKVTLESVEKMIEYDPTNAIELISPTPLLMIIAENDSLIPVEIAREAADRAGEPKEIMIVKCGHFDVYETEPWHSQVASGATEWFTAHLGK